MNVKISYTVPFEEVPEKVGSILADTSDDLHIVAKQIEDVANQVVDNPAKISNVNSLRGRLAAIDMAIGDCYSILAGYIGAKLAQGDPEFKESQNGESVTNREGGSSESTAVSDMERARN